MLNKIAVKTILIICLANSVITMGAAFAALLLAEQAYTDIIQLKVDQYNG